MRKWVYFVTIGSLVISLTACGGNRPGPGTGVGANNSSYGTTQLGKNDNIHRLGNYGLHNMNAMRQHMNHRIQVSQTIADGVTALDEVQSANVLLTDRNVYVAVVLNYGDSFDQYTQMYNQRYLDRNHINPNYNVKGITNHDINLTSAVKKKIIQKVHSMTRVNNVYVSANPDFVQRLSNYASELQSGRPISGLVNEFNALMQRVFPSKTGGGKAPLIQPINNITK